MNHLIKGRVSIIVPVYNTSETFLLECFESVRNQDYEDKELIIVNDGSSVERTNEFCKEYSGNNILWCKLIETSNQGVSFARNTGILAATGNRIMFVDSDDRLEPGAITRLVQVMDEQEADAVIGQDELRNTIPDMLIYGGKESLTALLDNREASFGWALWGKLFDTELMRYYYRPRKDIFYGEDLLVNAEYFANTCKVVVINEKVYFYRKDNPDSAMAQARTVKKLSLIRMWRGMADIYSLHGMNAEYNRVMANYYDSLLSGYLQCEYFRYDNYKQYMSDIKSELKDVLGDVMKNPYVNGKYRYLVAVYGLWIFRLKHRLQECRKK